MEISKVVDHYKSLGYTILRTEGGVTYMSNETSLDEYVTISSLGEVDYRRFHE